MRIPGLRRAADAGLDRHLPDLPVAAIFLDFGSPD
jgi:hypothetical protein